MTHQMDALHDATRTRRKARISLFGPSSSGKTYTAFIIARGIARALGMEDKPFVLLDTESGRGELYANNPRFAPYKAMGVRVPFSPDHYIAALNYIADEVEKQDLAPIVVIDSISHEWNGEGGIQSIVDEATARAGGNKWAAWSVATPMHNRFVEAILQSPLHVICTMRSKTEWKLDEKNRPIKIGLAPVQREELEYEFDLVFRMDMTNSAEVVKSFLEDDVPLGAIFEKPDAAIVEPIFRWLNEGSEPPKTVERPKEPEAAVADGEQATLAEGEAAAGENGGEKIKPATKGTITKLINELATSHPDFDRLTWADEEGAEPVKHEWEALALARAKEWFGAESVGDLTEANAQNFIERLRFTKETLDKAAAEAEPATL